MLRKNAALAFGGMWVFPGGRIDPGEGDGEDGARRAAVREAAEETGLVVDPAGLVPFAHWTPPAVAAKRFATWFFVAPAPDGVVAIDGGEIHDHVWVSPTDAITLQAAGDIELAPPTFVTLNQLRPSPDVASALARAAAGPVEYFATRVAKGPGGEIVTVWHGDAAYEGGDLATEGPRHRLAMIPGAWKYERSD